MKVGDCMISLVFRTFAFEMKGLSVIEKVNILDIMLNGLSLFQQYHTSGLGFLFFFIFSIFILLTLRKVTKLLVHRASIYFDLLPEVPRYCCLVKIFYFHFLFYRDMIEI